ncbi:MAG: hypothetical protein HYS81_00515 [Candidatus Aenigmatarchaeota archaeon]|nr:MAG: hypothetical protein HYS81_00515 [Candidatus Aenigmarchaeota archaeon]
MIIHRSENACPICGIVGQPIVLNEGSKAHKAHNCRTCGTVFNAFGVILSPHEHAADEMELN